MSELNIKLENDYVFIEQIKVEKSVTETGLIVIQDKVKFQDTLHGKVVAVSEHSPYPTTVAVGDIVYFTEVALKTRTKLNGKEYVVIPEKEILAYERA